jgi:Dolichyl-phosphate-mannose-protein mannosyltransferase
MSDSPHARTPASSPAPVVDRRWLLALLLLALVTRLIWVLWVHPPGDYVFSDMKKYLERATVLAEHGWQPGDRDFAWQAWGTHVLLALPLELFGAKSLRAAAAFWALLAAGAVPLAYLLAVRVTTRRWVPEIVGVLTLLWHPNVSNAGYFLSETPFLFFALASTLCLVIVLQEGRLGWLAGLTSAVAFAVRPQSALFYLLVLITWLVNRRRLPQVGARQLVAIALPLVAMLAFSAWRFHAHTGYWAGVAENANMNLTAGRCHNVVTQAFRTPADMRRSEKHGNTNDGRRVSLPNFRLAAKLPSWHPLALRPALGGETIRFVGYVGDPDVHREIRARCYAATGVLGQLHMSVVNLSLSWFLDRQWPEMERGRETFLPVVSAYHAIFAWFIWAPSMVGMFAALWWIRRRPALTVVAWQLVSSIVVAAIFFGTIRLRTPYDPYAFILAAEGCLLIADWLRARRARTRARHAAAPATTAPE